MCRAKVAAPYSSPEIWIGTFTLLDIGADKLVKSLKLRLSMLCIESRVIYLC
jgi:hypothetical protein